MEEPIHLVADIDDLKVIFRVLHLHLTEHPELLDVELFADLQRRLQRAAKLDGVDVTDHGAWEAWLGFQAYTEPPQDPAKKRQSLN